jgi:hypothetical protein
MDERLTRTVKKNAHFIIKHIEEMDIPIVVIHQIQDITKLLLTKIDELEKESLRWANPNTNPLLKTSYYEEARLRKRVAALEAANNKYFVIVKIENEKLQSKLEKAEKVIDAAKVIKNEYLRLHNKTLTIENCLTTEAYNLPIEIKHFYKALEDYEVEESAALIY